jgi:Ca2+/H+ antiporter
MNLDWLAPAYEDAKAPFEVPQAFTRKVALGFAAYIVFVIYPAYIGLRMLWGNYTFEWQSLVIAVVTAVVFGLFANKTMNDYFRKRPVRQSQEA